jgi:predicted nucleotidyltransferase component of viral defense system
MEITTRVIRTWADENGIPNLTLAELDYRLLHALRAIYADPFLREHLYLKGGTALNKVYIPNQGRLSVDLDFNAVGAREEILEERTQFSQRVMEVLGEQDSDYDFSYRWRYDQATVYARYRPLTGIAQQRLKVEISFIERFPILERAAPALSLPLFDESVVIHTYQLEELTSTKLRALYDRRKGRDIYDLFRIAALELNQTAVRKLVLYYFYRANKVFQPSAFIENVEQKIADRSFGDDVRGLIRHDDIVDWSAACQQVLAAYAFLGELDDRDLLFLDLAKYLLNKPYPKANETIIMGIERPLAWLMQDIPIAEEAAAKTQADLRIYLPDDDA